MVMTTSLLLALSGLVLATSFLSGIFGMAGGMILMGVLLPFLSVPAAMVLHAVTQMASNGWRAVLWRRYIDWRIVGRYAIGLIVAFALFALVRIVPNRGFVLITLGAMPFLAMLVPERLAPRADRPGGAEAAGLIGTALQLTSGVSAPILDIFFVRTTMDRRTVVATKASCQTITHFVKLIYFGGLMGMADGALGWPILLVSVLMAILGTSLSRAVLEGLTDIQFRSWTQRLVLGIGAVYVAQGVTVYIQG